MVVVVGLAVYSVQSVYVHVCVRACEYCIIVCTVVNETAAAAEADGRWDVTSVRYITNRRYVRTLMRWNAMLQCALVLARRFLLCLLLHRPTRDGRCRNYQTTTLRHIITWPVLAEKDKVDKKKIWQ